MTAKEAVEALEAKFDALCEHIDRLETAISAMASKLISGGHIEKVEALPEEEVARPIDDDEETVESIVEAIDKAEEGETVEVPAGEYQEAEGDSEVPSEEEGTGEKEEATAVPTCEVSEQPDEPAPEETEGGCPSDEA